MHSIQKVLIALVILVLLGLAGAGVFVYSGAYNIAADDPHTAPVEAAITTLRNRSIAARAKGIEAALQDDPKRIARGANQYAEMCVSCHAAPGVTEESEIRQGLYPRPPNLAKEGIADERQAFWVIKHGVKMSGMPAWGPTHDDDTIWDMVSFLKKMPAMSPEEYARLSTAEEGSGHSHGHSTATSPSMHSAEKHEEHGVHSMETESAKPGIPEKKHTHPDGASHKHTH